jgi:hypothetical protein
VISSPQLTHSVGQHSIIRTHAGVTFDEIVALGHGRQHFIKLDVPARARNRKAGDGDVVSGVELVLVLTPGDVQAEIGATIVRADGPVPASRTLSSASMLDEGADTLATDMSTILTLWRRSLPVPAELAGSLVGAHDGWRVSGGKRGTCVRDLPKSDHVGAEVDLKYVQRAHAVVWRVRERTFTRIHEHLPSMRQSPSGTAGNISRNSASRRVLAACSHPP